MIVDIYSGAQHKQGMDPENDSGGEDVAPAWVVDPEDRRRLNFYRRVEAYLETVSRGFIRESEDDPDKPEEWREFADPAIVVARIASGVLGDSPEIGVTGIDQPIPPSPELPPPPVPPDVPEGAGPEVAALFAEAYEAELGAYQETARQRIEAWVDAWAWRNAAEPVDQWLRSWAELEGIHAKLYEAETEHVVPLGDGVFIAGYDSTKAGVAGVPGRPTVEVYHPNSFFPEWSGSSEFPDVVHMTWEFQRVNDPDSGELLDEPEERVRRRTYRRLPIAESGVPPFTPAYSDSPATHAVIMSDASWLAEDVAGLDVRRFDQDAGPGEPALAPDPVTGEPLPQIDIFTGLDFIPVLHTPNSLSTARARHFGRSSIARTLQLFDELAETDTDAARAARWAGRPPVAVSGMTPGQDTLDMSPGKGFRLGENGSITTVDMGGNLLALESRLDDLLGRISVNAQVPAGLLGRVDASEVPSGLALALSFTPFVQLVESLRLARSGKYSLLLKMVQRIALVNGDESFPGAEVMPASIRFGPFMPQDLPGAAEVITRLLAARAISRETAVRLGMDAGTGVDDPATELAAINSYDAETAVQITQATENPRYGAEHLQIQNWEPDAAFDPEAGFGEEPDELPEPPLPAPPESG